MLCVLTRGKSQLIGAMTLRIRTYSELRRLSTIEDRFKYLQCNGEVGRSTFGFERHLNQNFYTSRQWRQVRNEVITRDNGCDLGIKDFEIHSRLLIHHMNPIQAADIINGEEAILDPEFLICTTHLTHNAIHYGDEKLLPRQLVERRPGDTKLW